MIALIWTIKSRKTHSDRKGVQEKGKWGLIQYVHSFGSRWWSLRKMVIVIQREGNSCAWIIQFKMTNHIHFSIISKSDISKHHSCGGVSLHTNRRTNLPFQSWPCWQDCPWTSSPPIPSLGQCVQLFIYLIAISWQL